MMSTVYVSLFASVLKTELPSLWFTNEILKSVIMEFGITKMLERDGISGQKALRVNPKKRPSKDILYSRLFTVVIWKLVYN